MAGQDDKETDAGVPGAAEFNDTADIYVSAPDSDGQVAIVGILPAGSPVWNTGQIVVGVEGGAENLLVEVGDDGSFALRIDAEALDSIRIAPSQDEAGNLDDNQVVFQLDRSGDASVGTRILGEDGSVSATGGGEVRITGRGDLLQAGARVVGGNLSLSSGAEAEVTCSPDCRFEMTITGESGDEIALFLAFPYGMQAADGVSGTAGSTAPQTVTVP